MQRKALIIIDGLDEMQEEVQGELFDELIKFKWKYPGNRFILTSRPSGLKNIDIKSIGEIYTIMVLNDNQIEDFIKCWFRTNPGHSIEKVDTLLGKMFKDIEQNKYIQGLARNPMHLTVICSLYGEGKKIPEQRAILYDNIVKFLLENRFHDVTERSHILDYLMRLAFTIHNKKRRDISKSEAEKLLEEYFPRKDLETEESYIRRIKKTQKDIETKFELLNHFYNENIKFTHLSFQEFLTAKYLCELNKTCQDYWGDYWWDEVIILYLDYYYSQDEESSYQEIENIFMYESENKVKERKIWLLGARALRNCDKASKNPCVLEIAKKRLETIIVSEDSLNIRYEAGEILGALGDHRISPGNMAKLITINASQYKLNNKDKYPGNNNQVVHNIELSEYLIGKFPVTNEEFSEFIKDGYKRDELWSDDGRLWKKEKEISEPWYWQDRDFNKPNFPVVGVSWYEAEAFCKWISSSGKTYQLPTEAQWEKAASGDENFIYPWGITWRDDCCNSKKAQLGRTSPVGIFVKGKSPCECMDMTGNVWEWCADRNREKEDKQTVQHSPVSGSSGYRILRGGSWLDSQSDLYISSRRKEKPGYRANCIGFRVVIQM